MLSDKKCYDMDYEDIKNLLRRTTSEKVLHDKAFNVAKKSKYGGYQCELTTIVYKLIDKMSATHKETGINSNAVSNNQQLAKELHKIVIKKLKKCMIYSSFKDKMLGRKSYRFVTNN